MLKQHVKELDIFTHLFKACMFVNEWRYSMFPVGADFRLSLNMCLQGPQLFAGRGQEG